MNLPCKTCHLRGHCKNTCADWKAWFSEVWTGLNKIGQEHKAEKQFVEINKMVETTNDIK
jgi:hypothetical protein